MHQHLPHYRISMEWRPAPTSSVPTINDRMPTIQTSTKSNVMKMIWALLCNVHTNRPQDCNWLRTEKKINLRKNSIWNRWPSPLLNFNPISRIQVDESTDQSTRAKCNWNVFGHFICLFTVRSHTDSVDDDTRQLFPQSRPTSQSISISKLAGIPPSTAKLLIMWNRSGISHRSSQTNRCLKNVYVYSRIISSMRNVNRMANTNRQQCTTNLLRPHL